MVTGHEVPLDVVAAIALGAVAGSAALLVTGRPSLRPNRRQLVEALGRSGLEVASLEHAGVDARGSTPYFAKLGDGRRLFVKALGQDEVTRTSCSGPGGGSGSRTSATRCRTRPCGGPSSTRRWCR